MSERVSTLTSTYADIKSEVDTAVENAEYTITEFPEPYENYVVNGETKNIEKVEWIYNGTHETKKQALDARNRDIESAKSDLEAKKGQCDAVIDTLTTFKGKCDESRTNLQKDVNSVEKLNYEREGIKADLQQAVSTVDNANTLIDHCFDCTPETTYQSIVEAKDFTLNEGFSDGTLEGAKGELNGYIDDVDDIIEDIATKTNLLNEAKSKLDEGIRTYQEMIHN